MTTARDIITAALKKIHIVGLGQNLTAQDANDGLQALNALIESWSAESDTIFTETRESFAIAAGAGAYSIGKGADFNTTRPLDITAAFVRDQDHDYPLQIESSTEYAQIWDKDQVGTPRFVYYDANYPTANILLWPTPFEAMTLHLYSKKPLDIFSDLDASLEMPPEYKRALIYNLAVELAPDFEKEAAASVQKIAAESKAILQTQNTRNDKHIMRADDVLTTRGRYHIFSDA